MTAPGAAGPKSTGVRLTVIGLLAAGVAVALYAAGGQPAAAGAAGAPGHRLWVVCADRADRRALPSCLRGAAHQPQGGGALARGLFLLWCLCREGAARSEQAAAGLGAAGRRRNPRHLRRRALVHLSVVVLQRFPPAGAVAEYSVLGLRVSHRPLMPNPG